MCIKRTASTRQFDPLDEKHLDKEKVWRKIKKTEIPIFPLYFELIPLEMWDFKNRKAEQFFLTSKELMGFLHWLVRACGMFSEDP